MPKPSDRFDEHLRAAFKAGVPEPEYEADSAPPEEVPSELRDRVMEQAAQYSTRLLAAKLRTAGEDAGWSVDDLASEAVGYEQEAKALLVGAGSPVAITPHAFARVIRLTQLEPEVWEPLLLQAVASQATHYEPSPDQVWGRTTGLSKSERAERLAGSKPQQRDPVWAERVARNFVDEVLEEWQRLTTGRS